MPARTRPVVGSTDGSSTHFVGSADGSSKLRITVAVICRPPKTNSSHPVIGKLVLRVNRMDQSTSRIIRTWFPSDRLQTQPRSIPICLSFRCTRLTPLNLNLHRLGCKFLRDFRGQFQHAIAIHGFKVFTLYSYGQRHGIRIASVPELTLKEVVFRCFFSFLTVRTDREHVATFTSMVSGSMPRQLGANCKVAMLQKGFDAGA